MSKVPHCFSFRNRLPFLNKGTVKSWDLSIFNVIFKGVAREFIGFKRDTSELSSHFMMRSLRSYWNFKHIHGLFLIQRSFQEQKSL